MKLKSVLLLVVAAVMLSGCTMGMTPIQGIFYTDFEAPLEIGDAAGYSKIGVAEGTAVVGFGAGDVSISAAMKNGGIKKIHHVDYHTTNVLGLFTKVKVKVYGE